MKNKEDSSHSFPKFRTYRKFNLFGLLKTVFFTVPPAISLLILIIIFVIGTMVNPGLLTHLFGPPGVTP